MTIAHGFDATVLGICDNCTDGQCVAALVFGGVWLSWSVVLLGMPQVVRDCWRNRRAIALTAVAVAGYVTFVVVCGKAGIKF
jgi:hypothetical protein